MAALTALPSFHIAIVGGGITGLCLGVGLLARNISFTVYERASGAHEVGAGIGLSPNAERAMKRLDEAVHAAYEKVANPNGEDYFQWVNGLSKENMFRLFVGEGCFRGCRRSDFLDGLLACLPRDRVRFGKQVRHVVEVEGGARIVFADGSEEVADAVIGCDGIRSRVRELVFGPASSCAATYSHKFSFRALIPMDEARRSLSEAMVFTRFMYNGPGAHIITYPVANNTMLNALAVVSDPGPWTAADGKNPHVGRATRREAQQTFEAWHPDVRAIIDLLPEDMDKWAIFDMLEHPAARYDGCGGRVCLAGDAAHAVGPHLGAGAGFGIEDALLLAELLGRVQDMQDRARGLAAAFAVFTDVRFERTQWLVRETRNAVDLFQWRDPDRARDVAYFGNEITWRFHRIWDYNVDDMVEDAKRKVDALVGKAAASADVHGKSTAALSIVNTKRAISG